jgi:endo-1,4-beta-mannosidase
VSEIRWTAENANGWYQRQPWLVGCNFTPSTAINQLEMWQAATFDPDTIGRELGWAAGIGMNAVRVYLHDLVWQADAEGFKRRIDRYLALAARKGIQTLFVLFDDCWNMDPKLGKQPEPLPGVHNSGWMQSPGSKVVTDPGGWARLESYVKDVLAAFAADERILMWDLYNEPGNNGLGDRSLALLQAAFGWARAARPQQPLTAGV